MTVHFAIGKMQSPPLLPTKEVCCRVEKRRLGQLHLHDPLPFFFHFLGVFLRHEDPMTYNAKVVELGWGSMQVQ